MILQISHFPKMIHKLPRINTSFLFITFLLSFLKQNLKKKSHFHFLIPHQKKNKYHLYSSLTPILSSTTLIFFKRYTAHFSATDKKNPNLSQHVDIIKRFTFLKKYIPFFCSKEVKKKNASIPFFFFHFPNYFKKNMDSPSDTNDCNTESGFILPHKQPQTHPPLKKYTKHPTKQ